MNSVSSNIRFKDHPPGLRYLFFSEMWERFSFYGMRALLLFYITQEYSYTQDHAYGIYATYTALVYITPVFGGMIADRIIGEQKAIMAGGILIAFGHICLTFPGEWLFFCGLSSIISGTGLYKANTSSLLGKLYKRGDHRLDAGFTLYYVGINIGAFLSPLVCGIVGELYGWHFGFGLAAIGMLIGLLYFFRGIEAFGKQGLPPEDSIYSKPVLLGLNWEKFIYILAFLSIPMVALIIKNHQSLDYILTGVGLSLIGFMIFLLGTYKGLVRQNIFTFFVLVFFLGGFTALFEQAGSSMNFFTLNQVDRHFLSWEIPATSFQGIGPFILIICAPLVAKVWLNLGVKNKDPHTPFKFFVALLLAAIGLIILSISTNYAASNGLVSLWWIVAVIFIHTLGDIIMAPVALSMVGKLAPPKLSGTFMGIFFISISYGYYVAGALAKLSSIDTNITETTANLSIYSSAFSSIAYIGFGLASLLLFVIPLLNRSFRQESHDHDYSKYSSTIEPI